MKTNSNNNRESMTAANVASNNNKIADFGKKIGGARKDLYAAAREWADRLADITADKLAAAGLSKLVRLPNLESMTAAGAISADQARAALALWRTIDRKPAGTYKADRWADRTRETLAAIAAILTAEDLATVLSDDLAALPDFQVLTAANWPAEAFTFGRYQVRRRPAYYSNAGKLGIIGGHYYVGTSSDDPADIAAQLRTMTAADSDRAAESRARGPKLGIYHTSDGTRYFIAVENKCEIVLKVCDTYREAAEAVKNDRPALLERYNSLKSFPALRRSWNRPRVGREWHAEDVTPEQFGADLPFRGVEFGNWLNQQERAALLNSAFDGFHDLADLLGIPAEAVALGGRLNFSFATRGTANSAAHFESLYNTINLNKRNGAGCMAHEWLHACDHYAAVLSGRGNCSSWGEAFATEYTKEAATDADQAARDLVAVIKTMDYYTRSRNYQRISGKQQGGENYYTMPCELAARGFEGVCLYLLQSVGGCSDFLVNLQSWQDFERDDAGHRRDCYPYPSEAEAAALLPYYMKFFRALFGRCEVSEKAAEGVAAATLQAAQEKAEADRLAAEKAEQERKAAEAIRAARRAEQEQKAVEARAKAEHTRAAIVDRLTAAHFDTIATGYDSAAVYFAAHMQGEIFTGSIDIKTTETEAVTAAQAAPLARVQYKRVHNAKRIICRRWKGAEVRANKYTAAEVLAELDGAEVRTIARTFADFEKAETWTDAAHLWDDTQKAHEEQAARARQAAQEHTAAKEPTDSKAESRKADSKAENGQGATISDPRAAGLQLVTIYEGVAVVGAAEDERTRGRQTWKARRDIKAHGCTWNKQAQQWEATTAEAVAAVWAWFGESDEQSASEGTEAPAAELTPVYYSNREESQPAESEPAAIAASDEQGAPVIESPKIEEIAAEEMLTQWQTIKEKHPGALLLFRLGDYYELYQDDAEKAAELLGLTIQTTASGYKIAAFPHYDISELLRRLIRAGHRVAICDQLEAPKQKTVARGCTEQTKEQTEEPPEQGAPMAEPPAEATISTDGEDHEPTLYERHNITAGEREAKAKGSASYIRRRVRLARCAFYSHKGARIETSIAYRNGTDDPDGMSYKVCWYDETRTGELHLVECENGISLEQAARHMADFALLSECGLTLREILYSAA